ncbi:hypothetical protein FEM08_30510 [Flavobacterium gilvum]|nr:hypothetical protein FEM08_30510 [Flavobacterium gilvum]
MTKKIANSLPFTFFFIVKKKLIQKKCKTIKSHTYDIELFFFIF